MEEETLVDNSGAASAMNLFKNKCRVGTELLDTKLSSTHQNQVQLLNKKKFKQ